MKYIIILCAIFTLLLYGNNFATDDNNENLNIDNTMLAENTEDYTPEVKSSNNDFEIDTSFEYDNFYVDKPADVRIKIVATGDYITDIPVEIRFPNYNYYEIVSVDSALKEERKLSYNAIIRTSTEDNPKENVFVFKIKFKQPKDININLNFPPKYSEFNHKEYIKAIEYDLTFKTTITAATNDFSKGTESGKNVGIFTAGDTIYVQLDIEAKSLNEDNTKQNVPVTIYIPDSTYYDVEWTEGKNRYFFTRSDFMDYRLNDYLDKTKISNFSDFFTNTELSNILNIDTKASNYIKNYLFEKKRFNSFYVNVESHYGQYAENTFKLKIKTYVPTIISIYVWYPEEYSSYDNIANFEVGRRK